MIAYRITLPSVFRIIGLKPWEVHLEDTSEIWKFTSYKDYTSLDALCDILGVESPKEDITGADVGRVYYTPMEKSDLPWDTPLERIGAYCERDIISTANCYQRITGGPEIQRDEIQIVKK
jgi:hypothetical protein